ncbi:hypothetical protein SESI111939_16170 [Serratia silvae]
MHQTPYVRTEGAIYGFFNFITKIAMAIGGGCAGLMLDYFDYFAAINSTAELHIMTDFRCLPLDRQIVARLQSFNSDPQ